MLNDVHKKSKKSKKSSLLKVQLVDEISETCLANASALKHAEIADPFHKR
jgi:hypothetical protein